MTGKKKGNIVYCHQAFERCLELIALTLDSLKDFSRLKELARLKEALLDYFYGTNQFFSSETLWKKYFDAFIYAARKNH